MSALRVDRAVAWLYVATMVANALSFGYQFVMARLLAPAEYAILTALFGYLILEAIGAQVIQSAAAKLAAGYRARAEDALLHAFTRRWLRRIALGAGLPAVAVTLLAAPLGGALVLPPLTIVLLGVALFTTALLTFTQGLLQGLRRFGWLGTVLLVQAGVRLALGVALALAGSGVLGAFGAATAAPAIGVLVTLVVLRPLLFGGAPPQSVPAPLGNGGAVPENAQARAETRFFLLAAVVLLGYAGLINLDALLLRALLSPAEAGAYAGVITLGKVVLFAPLAVGFILLERTARAHAKGEDTEHALLLALGLVLVTSGAVAVAYLVAPAFFVTVIVGTQYPGTAALAGRYGIAALANALLSIWIAYFVGRGAMRVGLLLALALVIEAVLLLSVARDALGMVTVVLVVALGTQVAAIVTFVLQRRAYPTRM
ncbi:MAG: hypothetical protein EXR61_02320 [Chloroflexi bacterium]|nr:hypothetical protein [Chloroflexota bacterium]